MQATQAALIVGIVLIVVLVINAAIFSLLRRDKSIDFGYYRLLTKTARDARKPIMQPYEELDELAKLVAPYKTTGSTTEPSTGEE